MKKQLRTILNIFRNPYVFAVTAKFTMVAVGFLYAMLNARFLGPELKGQVSYINSITGITMIVFTLGIHQAYPYYKRENVENIRNKYVHAIFFAFLVYVVLAAVITPFMLGDIRVTIAVWLTPPMVLSKLSRYLIMLETPNKKNRWELLFEVAEVIVLFFLYLFAERNMYWIIGLLAAKNIISSIYYLWDIHEDLKITKTDVQWFGKFAAFGFLPMLALLMNNLNYRIDVLMMGRIVPDAQIGIYSVGISIAEKIWLVSDSLRDVLYSKLVKGRDTEEVNKVIRISVSACTVLVLGLAALGKPFIILCFGKDYAESYYPMLIILFGTLVMVYYKIIQAYNIVHKKQKTNFLFLIISVIVNVVMNWFLIPVWGIYGAAAASLASYTVCALCFIFEYSHATKSRITDMLILKKSDIEMLKGLFKKKKKAE